MRKNILNWMKLSSFIFALSSLFASCSNELDEALQPANDGTLQFVVSDFPAFGKDGQTRVIGTSDVGKTAWAPGDKLLLSITFENGKKQGYTLEYSTEGWSLDDKVLTDSNITGVLALYAPDCKVKSDGSIGLVSGKQYGMAEYIPAKTTFEGFTVTISFTDVTRTYSRLRIAAVPGVSLIVATTGFTPAGADNSSSESGDVQQTEEAVTCTLTADEKGNAYLYGTFAANATVTVNDDLAEHAFTNATVAGESYALDCCSWPYLTFTADAEQTMRFTAYNAGYYFWHESMEYSVNESEWAQLTKDTPILFGGDKGTLRLRAKSSEGTSNGSLTHAKISFDNSNVMVECSGDIRTLVDYANYATVSTANAKFCYLFDGCTNLTTAPELPATELAYACYLNMFQNCTSLTEAPELPATTLTDYCYQYMFYGCTNLKEAPRLPATELADYCYQNMFYGCTSLTTAPELPATTLTQGCYNYMFYRCTNLTNAPELPATALANDCYQFMFWGCTNLTKAPELPATALGENCYGRMFFGCTNLTEAPELPATTLARSCYIYMFGSCTSLTTAPALPATTLVNSCYQRMFQGCTGLTEAPELPATTLAEHCYNGMFYGCTGLTEAPVLPATRLVNSCYKNMFNGCTSLNNITMLATNISATDCLLEWVSGVSPSGTFYKNSGATWDVTGTNGIPDGWTVVYYTAPEE